MLFHFTTPTIDDPFDACKKVSSSKSLSLHRSKCYYKNCSFDSVVPLSVGLEESLDHLALVCTKIMHALRR